MPDSQFNFIWVLPPERFDALQFLEDVGFSSIRSLSNSRFQPEIAILKRFNSLKGAFPVYI